MREIHAQSKLIFHNEIFEYDRIMERIFQIESIVLTNIRQESLVAIALERSPDVIFTMLAMLRLGITFLPLDLKHPKERIEYIIKDSGVHTVITSSNYKKLFTGVNIISLDDSYGISSVTIQKQYKSELAYVLYTSGTTGNPKGVMIKREGLRYFIDGMAKCIDFRAKKRILCLTTAGFDIFFMESIVPVYLGLTVILADDEEKNDQEKIAELIAKYDINMLQMTPSALQMLINNQNGKKSMENISDIMVGGEKFPHNLLLNLKNVTKAKIYNMYGPTETTIWSMVSDLTDKNSVNIGFPIYGTEVFILDENRKPVAEGEDGEIYIAGKGLAEGYLGKEELTSKKFVKIIEEQNIMAFRTGDLGRFLPDKTIQYIGRVDNQIKFYGYRIELEEIESVLNQIPGIDKAIVFVENLDITNKRLVAAYIGVNKSYTEIKEYISKKLPKYMIPADFIKMDKFKYNMNGKLDRDKTIRCILDEEHSGILMNPKSTNWTLNNILRKIIEIISDFIGKNDGFEVSADSKLSDLNIDSIEFIQIIVTLEETFQINFDYEKMTFAAFSTIYSMAQYISTKV
ncbi:non-ribosomal peptide synthetase [Clostridium saccharoperbutylacetonicum]|uniref:Dimodular nonribosomal peptide synthase DhbF n=1 Tax=Clostridium saccharoperbutylacetonicum N1-4(HMT) TaxID=931276 RepID=M1LMV1_9CLOT|nr:non-ribosomal peptide synthetase [Clostridium saccharoperbutylacetonicum]AGF54130.1 dimodular nonribosomal peptide synthase DhbF [Clostridium saccharoperbutylacetonicum N1-4(HMT)]AQR93032.1 dimodular nonribosomal peptide synthase [Clostridium saccharoperbutylacetonicum]NRT59356.1 amino acid adenylation domain-containing protein [Clostridium saccharoperbutylacetonicum]NSB28547.1 amino acid adenylation domain-containing protein [Clostridium saccharoperbutylacetonicum]NSB34443.1 amino acid ade